MILQHYLVLILYSQHSEDGLNRNYFLVLPELVYTGSLHVQIEQF